MIIVDYGSGTKVQIVFKIVHTYHINIHCYVSVQAGPSSGKHTTLYNNRQVHKLDLLYNISEFIYCLVKLVVRVSLIDVESRRRQCG